MTPEEKGAASHDPEGPIPPPPGGKPKAPAAGGGGEQKPKKSPFRVVPADPKNTIHFEDAADK
jgi:hypothetical protein